MNIAETLRSLRRRWYIVLPGLILAAALAFGAWSAVKPGYERSATQLLLPGADSVPAGGNPYIYIGGLTQAADVVVRAVGSRNVLEAIEAEYPGADVEVSRDATASGPLIVITVLAPSDAAAAGVIEDLVTRTATVLEDLQDEEDIVASNRIKVIPVTVDEQSVLDQKDRITAAAGVGIGVVVVTLVMAALIDGLLLSRKRRRGSDAARANKRARPATARAGDDPDEEESPDEFSDSLEQPLTPVDQAATETDEVQERLAGDDTVPVDHGIPADDEVVAVTGGSAAKGKTARLRSKRPN